MKDSGIEIRNMVTVLPSSVMAQFTMVNSTRMKSTEQVSLSGLRDILTPVTLELERWMVTVNLITVLDAC